jgi:hypothetical protein
VRRRNNVLYSGCDLQSANLHCKLQNAQNQLPSPENFSLPPKFLARRLSRQSASGAPCGLIEVAEIEQLPAVLPNNVESTKFVNGTFKNVIKN